MGLSRLAEALLADMAADQEVESITPNEHGIVAMEIGDVILGLGFSEPREAVYVMSVMTDDPSQLPDWPWIGFSASLRISRRPTRLAVEPGSGALVLITQVPLRGLRYPVFAEALDQFLQDVRDIRATLRVSRPSGGSLPLNFDPGEFLIRI